MPFSAINDVFMLKDKSELLQGVSRFLPKIEISHLKYGKKCNSKFLITFTENY